MCDGHSHMWMPDPSAAALLVEAQRVDGAARAVDATRKLNGHTQLIVDHAAIKARISTWRRGAVPIVQWHKAGNHVPLKAMGTIEGDPVRHVVHDVDVEVRWRGAILDVEEDVRRRGRRKRGRWW